MWGFRIWAGPLGENALLKFVGVQERHTSPRSKVTVEENRTVCCKTAREKRSGSWILFISRESDTDWQSLQGDTAWQHLLATTERRDLPFWEPVPCSFKQICSLEGCRHLLLNRSFCFSICICQILFLQCICFFKASSALFNTYIFPCYASVCVKEMNNILQEKA